MTETLLEEGDLRVRLVLDEYPSKPYDDGGSPIVRVDRLRGKAEQVTDITSYVVSDAALGILWQFAIGDLDDDERDAGLRVVTGATQVETYSSPGGHYLFVSFDPADWRELVGAPEASVSMGEWIAYCEGDAYGWVIEERVTWVRLAGHTDGTSCAGRGCAWASQLQFHAQETQETWEHVDSCFGFYGYEFAAQAAREEFAARTSESAA